MLVKLGVLRDSDSAFSVSSLSTLAVDTFSGAVCCAVEAQRRPSFLACCVTLFFGRGGLLLYHCIYVHCKDAYKAPLGWSVLEGA